MISILKSIYSDEFEGCNSNTVFLLNEEESIAVWIYYIDKKAKSYFQLPDDNWLVTSYSEVVGEWINDYNKDIAENVKGILDKVTVWSDNDKVWFCIRKTKVIETVWSEFKSYWMNFIECEDDSPILINESISNCAIIFRSMGVFVKI